MNGLLAAHVIVLLCMAPATAPIPPERSGPRACVVADDAAAAVVTPQLEDALTFLAAHGLTPVGRAPLVAVGALDGVGASGRAVAVVDAASHGLGERWAGHPAVLLEPPGPGTTSADPEALLHELVHVWLRTRGAPEPGWTTRGSPNEPGVSIATHESAVIEEALADFITAARSRAPVLYRASARPGTPARSVRGLGARCPEALSGHPHEDASVLTGALWEAATQGGAGAFEVFLASIAQVAPSNTHRIHALAEALTADLRQRSPAVARAWGDAMRARGLSRCQAPISVALGRSAQSPLAQPLLPGTRRLAPVASLQRYEVDVSGLKAISVGVRFFGQDAPGLRWAFTDARERTVASGASSLDVKANGSAFAALDVPHAAARLRFRWINPRSTPIVFDDVKAIPLDRPRPQP